MIMLMELLSDLGKTNENFSLRFINLGQYGRTLPPLWFHMLGHLNVETASNIVYSKYGRSQQKERSRVGRIILIPELLLQLCPYFGYVSQQFTIV